VPVSGAANRSLVHRCGNKTLGEHDCDIDREGYAVNPSERAHVEIHRLPDEGDMARIEAVRPCQKGGRS
jgi:hypothetical protein